MRPRSSPNPPRDLPPRFESLEARQLCAVDLAGSLIAHWTFEDAGNAPAQFADVSPDGPDHAATPVGDVFLRPQNAFNQTLQLDGSGDRLSVGNTNEINLAIQGQRTVAFWFNADDVTLGTRKQIIYEEGGTSRGLNMYLSDGRLYVGGWNIPGDESAWAGTWLSTAGIASGQWHHVALVLDGGAATSPDAFRGYLDGRAFGVGTGSQLWPHSGSITLGDHSDGTLFHDETASGSNTAGFAGQLDDGRVYNRALHPTEVLTLARGPAAVTPAVVAGPTAFRPAELEYARAPDAQIAIELSPPSSPTNTEQLPDFPARAVTPSDPSPSNSANSSELPADVWNNFPPSFAPWDQFIAELLEELPEDEDHTTTEAQVPTAPPR